MINKLFLLFNFLCFSLLSYSQCPTTVVTLTSQEEVNDFAANYPNCTDLQEDLFVQGPSITNLNGLNMIVSVDGSLDIGETNVPDLTGLGSLISVTGEFRIEENSIMVSLEGVSSLVSVRRFFVFGNKMLTSLDGVESLSTLGDPENLIIVSNPVLQNIEALSNVTNCPGCFISINNNPLLESLQGLQNIPFDSMFNLFITGNDNLVICNLQNICDYLASGVGFHEIENNAVGCNSKVEVEEACLDLSVSDLDLQTAISVFPNPVSNQLHISSTAGIDVDKVMIYSITGTVLISSSETELNISQLSNGVYFVVVNTSKGVLTKKIAKT